MIRRAISILRKRLGLLAILVICQLAHVLASLWMLVAILVGSEERAWKIGVGYDKLTNVTTGGNENETVSSRAARERREGRAWSCILCAALDLIDPNHCTKNEGK